MSKPPRSRLATFFLGVGLACALALCIGGPAVQFTTSVLTFEVFTATAAVLSTAVFLGLGYFAFIATKRESREVISKMRGMVTHVWKSVSNFSSRSLSALSVRAQTQVHSSRRRSFAN